MRPGARAAARLVGAHLAGALAVLALAGPASAERPEILYMLHCRGCHQPDGAGSQREGVPALAGELGRFLTVPGGRAYLVQVPGSAQSPLDDADLARLLNWMVERFGPEAVARDFRRYTGPEVAEHRATRLTDVEAVRARLVKQFEATRATSP